ncbi:MAG: lipase [Lachnospiraceae bacterium]|nr:lipase [Candidatus Colinaster equi]
MNKKWVSTWGNAMSIAENRPESYAKDITLRYSITTAFAGEKIRITLDNYCGTEQVNITKVTALHHGKFYGITFGGKTSVTISAKNAVVSDEIGICCNAKDDIEISIYLGEYTKLRSCVYASGPLSIGKYAIGDYSEIEDIPIEVSRKTNIYYFLSNVSLYTEAHNRAIVCYGDSITAQDWPDYLQKRCFEQKDNRTSIVRRATSGSRILRQYSCITYESYGLMGMNRFEHEVPTDGADTVIIQQGINDIIHPVGTDINPFRPMSDLPKVSEMIDGLKWYIKKAREYKYKVYVGTLLPIEGWRTYELFRNEMRNEFNEWIRNTDLIDGVIDFDKAVADTCNQAAFLAEYDSGDHLHPSDRGYKRMAEEVDITIIK